MALRLLGVDVLSVRCGHERVMSLWVLWLCVLEQECS